MTTKLIASIKLIRGLTYQSFQMGGKLQALLENPESDPASIERHMEKMLSHMENAVIEMRNTCENDRPNELIKLGKPILPDMSIAGRIEVNSYGWLHIELKTLLPHCRFHTPIYLMQTIINLLDDYERSGSSLPRYDNAILIIDEHCNISSRTVYDQDNKGWKAIPNAIKGRIIIDDDQFALEVALLSTVSDIPACHIYILPQTEAGDFFLMRNDDLL
jgi:hypothetical protein